jgi:hypothetical protein
MPGDNGPAIMDGFDFVIDMDKKKLFRKRK